MPHPFTTISEALSQSRSRTFGVVYKNGKFTANDPLSFFAPTTAWVSFIFRKRLPKTSRQPLLSILMYFLYPCSAGMPCHQFNGEHPVNRLNRLPLGFNGLNYQLRGIQCQLVDRMPDR